MKVNSWPRASQIENLLKSFTHIPLWKIVDSELSPFEIYKRMPKNSYRFLLESGKVGRYSFIGGDPLRVLVYKQDSSTESIRVLREWLGKHTCPERELLGEGLPPFLCGAVGFASYDFGRSLEQLPNIACDDLETPDLLLMEPSKLFIKDHETQELYIVTSLSSIEDLPGAYSRLAEMESWISGQHIADGNMEMHEQMATCNTEGVFSLTKQQFEDSVERIKEYIRSGDVFQVNLSLRESRECSIPPANIYRELRKINPSPYMGLLEFDDWSLVSCSPELLVSLQGSKAETRPIAGTRKRSGDREYDLKMIAELRENEKERAEHIMLVDLERNDLGRVCKFGTVSVDELMVIEEYSHVMHIVSHVSGEMREDADGVDLFAATFPGGTITGAPKIRTMEIIEELEPVRRGIYTGSFGWWSYNGDLELNIAIRTMIVKNGMAHVQAGAGVVIDSVPEREYFESLRKAQALWQAFELAHGKGTNK